ncbi:MAG: glycosyltransferase [Gammaproteobacteria bacterium]|nr:glycosyltransferase [Gammaproteobacteria bacterium]
MNVAIFATSDFPDGTATAYRLRMLGRCLVEENVGCYICLIHPSTKGRDETLSSDDQSVDGITFFFATGRNKRPIQRSARIIEVLKGWFGSVRFLWRLRKRQSIDAILLFTPNFVKVWPIILYGGILRIPLFSEVCEIRSSMVDQHVNVSTILKLGNQVTETLIPLLSRGVIAISRPIRDFYVRKGVKKEDVIIIPALVETSQFSIESSDKVPPLENSRYFLSSGSLNEKEGLSYLLEALSKLRETHEDVSLVLTGGIKDAEQLTIIGMAKEYDVSNAIVFTGMLTREELAWAYQNAQGLLACRVDSKFAQYGFPNKLVEYLASGTPVILTPIGDIGAYLRDPYDAYFAEARSGESIAVKMMEVLSNPNQARVVGRSGQEVAFSHFERRMHSRTLTAFLQDRL